MRYCISGLFKQCRDAECIESGGRFHHLAATFNCSYIMATVVCKCWVFCL